MARLFTQLAFGEHSSQTGPGYGRKLVFHHRSPGPSSPTDALDLPRNLHLCVRLGDKVGTPSCREQSCMDSLRKKKDRLSSVTFHPVKRTCGKL